MSNQSMKPRLDYRIAFSSGQNRARVEGREQSEPKKNY